MDIVVIGGSSFIGLNVCADLARRHQIVYTVHKRDVAIEGCTQQRLDITGDVDHFLSRIAPDAVVLLSSILTDECELKPELARRVNVDGTANVARACETAGVPLLFSSSAYVFDGIQGMYKETDKMKPIDVYGHTKMLAEQALAASMPSGRYAILRFSYVYGPLGKNIFRWFADTMKASGRVNAYTDQYMTPTLTSHISTAIERIIERKSYGILHIADYGRANKYDFFKEIARQFGIAGEIVPIQTADQPQPAPRPPDSSLNNEKAVRELGDIFTDMKGGVRELKNLLYSRPHT